MIDLQKLKDALQAIDQSSVQYYSGKSVNAVASWIMYLLGVAFIAFIFICETVFPLHLLGKIAHSDTVIAALGSKADAQTFVIAIKGMLVLIGLLLIYMGSLLGKLNAKNTLLRNTAVTLGKFIGDNSSLEVANSSKSANGFQLKELEAKEFEQKIGM
jgi:hypothetical protein